MKFVEIENFTFIAVTGEVADSHDSYRTAQENLSPAAFTINLSNLFIDFFP